MPPSRHAFAALCQWCLVALVGGTVALSWGSTARADDASTVPCSQDRSCATSPPACDGETADAGGARHPKITEDSGAFLADGSRVDTTISKDPADGIQLSTDDLAICVTPADTSARASEASVGRDGASVRYEDTASDTTTVVVPKADGVETFDIVRSKASPEDFSFTVDAPTGSSLLASADGSIAIIDPSPESSAPPQQPTTSADDQRVADLNSASSDARPDDSAANDAVHAADISGALDLPPPSSDGDTAAARDAASEDPKSTTLPPVTQADAPNDPPATLPDGDPLLADQLGTGVPTASDAAKAAASRDLASHQESLKLENQSQQAANAGAAVQAPTTATLGVIEPPTAHDANGDPVPATMSVDGNTVTVHVDHQGEGIAYPITVDPWIRVNDYKWVDHCCQPTYEWQPRSHQETRLQYTGSYYGSLMIAVYPHFFWGTGSDGKALYAVYVDWSQQWVIVHNEAWSGVFVPVTVTVQDPPEKVLVGWQHYQTYDLVGYHSEWRFDPAQDCNDVAGVVIPAQCGAAFNDIDDEANDENPLLTQLAAPRGATGKLFPVFLIDVKRGNWVTARSDASSYVMATARNGQTMTVTGQRQGCGSTHGSGCKTWFFGHVSSLRGGPCRWIESNETLPRDPDYGSNGSNCATGKGKRLEVSDFGAQALNCAKCGGGTAAYLTKNVIECPNVGLDDQGNTGGCDTDVNSHPYWAIGRCVLWRYITTDNQWVLVRDRGRNLYDAGWVFIPRSALPATSKLYAPKPGTHCPAGTY